MSIFTRFKDIVEANINAMLDKAENPERMLRLMIQDIEDTLVELKSSCAQVMAERSRVRRTSERIEKEVDRWTERAQLALAKGREELAREALLRKSEVLTDIARLAEELHAFDGTIERYQDEIGQLEEKLLQARDKYRFWTSPREKAGDTNVKPQKTEATQQAAKVDKVMQNEQIEKELSELKAKLNNNSNTGNI